MNDLAGARLVAPLGTGKAPMTTVITYRVLLREGKDGTDTFGMMQQLGVVPELAHA